MKHRKIQREQDERDRSKPKAAGKSQDAGAGQAGAREQPVRLPAQHLTKPGNESDLELEPRFLVSKGIRVNAVAPGPVWTPLNPADRPAQEVAEFGKNTDMKRAAQPEEVSPAYVFLASPVCSSYITGIVLPVTGSVGAI